MDFIRFRCVTQFWQQKVREKKSVEESILRVSAEPIMATDTVSKSSDTATEPPASPDCCQLQEDALRGAMHECKRAMQLVKDRQEAWFQCKYKVSLQGIGTDTKNATYDAAIRARAIGASSGFNAMSIGLEQIRISSGVRVDD